jgi:alpha-ribazole phosphatase
MLSQPERVTTIHLLRHGACQGGEIYRGRTDVQLSSEGWQQMEQAISAAPDWQRIITSPLLRCREFGEHCAARFNIPLQIDTALQEMDFGGWEGRLVQEVWQENPELVARFYDDPAAVTPPGGESCAEAQSRIVVAWHALLQQCAGDRLLLVCHGGVIRLLLAHLLAMPLAAVMRLYIPYASMAQVSVYHRDSGDVAVLMSLNGGDRSIC